MKKKKGDRSGKSNVNGKNLQVKMQDSPKRSPMVTDRSRHKGKPIPSLGRTDSEKSIPIEHAKSGFKRIKAKSR